MKNKTAEITLSNSHRKAWAIVDRYTVRCTQTTSTSLATPESFLAALMIQAFEEYEREIEQLKADTQRLEGMGFK